MSMDASLQEEWVCISCGAEVVTDESECPLCGSASDPLQGRVLAGKYRLIKKLAGGGMGHVYLAEHTRLRYKKERAIKILRAELLHDNTLRKRFLREVELTHLVSQDNPHIVHIHDDYGFEDGIGFYVMEFLEGDTLEDRIAKAPSGHSMAWVQEIALQICNAMQSIHEADIVHRDLKPANIFLIKDKEGADFVKVMDFGIAKAEHAGTQHTKEGAIIGTAQYLAPEQIRRLPGMPIDGRCDVYAMGCILFELLAGRAPFCLESSTAAIDGMAGMSMAFQTLVMKHLTEPPPSLRSLRPEIVPELSRLVDEMLAKSPESRPPDMATIAERLRAMTLPDHMPRQDLPSGHFPNTDTVPSQDLPSELLRNSAALTAHTPPPEDSGFSGATVSSQSSIPRPHDDLDHSGGSKRMLFAIFLGLFLIGGSAGVFVYKSSNPAASLDQTKKEPRVPAKKAPSQDAGNTKRPTPSNAPDAGAQGTTPDAAIPTEKAAKQPVLRRKTQPPKQRPKKRRPAKWRRVRLRIPPGYFSRFALRISPRKAARRRGNWLLRSSRRSISITVVSKREPFGFYRCSFTLSSRTRQLTLKPLMSKSGLAPDGKQYCRAR